MNTKTFRVPKRVREQAGYGLAEMDRLESVPAEAVQVASFLVAERPVGPAILRAMSRYFIDNPRKPLTTPLAKMYGGKAGKEWAARTISATAPKPLVAAGELDHPGWDPTDEEIDAMIEFSKAMVAKEQAARGEQGGNEPPEALVVESEPVVAEMSATEVEVSSDEPIMVETEAEEAPAEEEGGDFDETIERLREQVDAALGLATQLDDTVTKLSDTMEEAVEAVADAESEMAEEEYETELAVAALAELEALRRADEAEKLSTAVAAARERMTQASLVRERSMAMARMASRRSAPTKTLPLAEVTLAAEGAPLSPAKEEAAAPAGDAVPKEPSADHHSESQPRDWHGRFAKVGARVQSKSGNMGYVTGIKDGNLTIATDDGEEVTVDPKSVAVVSRKGRARLSKRPTVIEDVKGRLESYLEWAKEQLGVTAAGVGPSTVTPGNGPSGLFLALVDSVDPSAVLNLLAVIPKADGSGLQVFERKAGGWIEAPKILQDLMGLTPPSVVELDRESLLAVVEQMDAYDKKKSAGGEG